MTREATPAPVSHPYADPRIWEIQAVFVRAVGLHQQGQLAQAKAMYEDILKRHPSHFESLMHLLRGDFQTGWDLYESHLRCECAGIPKRGFHQPQSRIRDLGVGLQDLSDTAALCGLMDVVISVDTRVAHLSRALGRETQVLIFFSPDWRWFLHRDDCPWYPTFRLYRQRAIADWEDVFKRVRTDLIKTLDMGKDAAFRDGRPGFV